MLSLVFTASVLSVPLPAPKPAGDLRPEIQSKTEESESERLAALLQEEIHLATLLLKAFPDREDALVVMGNVHARHGDTDQAIHYWKKAAQADPNRVELYAKIANLASQTDQYETVIAMWRKVLEIVPKQQGAHYEIANAQMQLGDHEACIREVEQEIALCGDTPENSFLLGQAYQQRREYEKARDRFRRVIELHPITDRPITVCTTPASV